LKLNNGGLLFFLKISHITCMYSEGTKREVAETAIKRVDSTTDE
jgi:hypothetical protein